MDNIRVNAKSLRNILYAQNSDMQKTLAVIRSDLNKKLINSAKSNLSHYLYEVPLHYAGQKPYNRETMGQMLIQQLIEDGYTVKGSYTHFDISWCNVQLGKISKKEDIDVISIPFVKKSIN